MVHFNTGAYFGGQVVSLITYTSIVTPQRPMTFVLPVLFSFCILLIVILYPGVGERKNTLHSLP